MLWYQAALLLLVLELMEETFQGMTTRAAGKVPQVCKQLPSCRAVVNIVLSDNRVSAVLWDRLQGLLFSRDFVLQGLVKLPW